MNKLENKPLAGMTIVDFSQRLPGPLAGKILRDLGATVIKVENQKYPDPFRSSQYLHQFDESFQNWYQEINVGKEFLSLDFSSAEGKLEMQHLLDRSQGLLLGIPRKVKQDLHLTSEILKNRQQSLGVVELFSSVNSGEEHLHDLNALALSGTLSLHINDSNENIVAPPFLPFAGIAFGQSVATHLLAAMLKSQMQKKVVIHPTYLLQTVKEIFSPFWSPSLQKKPPYKYLHNGAFPCYCLYKTLDGHYVAMAAVEEKFWNGVQKIFSLPLNAEERFRRDPQAFLQVSTKFLQLTSEEIQKMITGKNLCLHLVYRLK